MNPIVRKVLLHALLPLIAGLIIYWFWRPEVWFIQLFSNRQALLRPEEMNQIQQFLVYSGPDFCWAYSLSSALFIWQEWNGRPVKNFSIFVFLLIILSEAVQIFANKIFSFDLFDLIAAVAAFALSYLLTYRNEKK